MSFAGTALPERLQVRIDAYDVRCGLAKNYHRKIKNLQKKASALSHNANNEAEDNDEEKSQGSRFFCDPRLGELTPP
jgi:hypothetical protein